MITEIDLPDFAEELFNPYRYKVLAGGRGSAKSETFARVLLGLGKKYKLKILCAREFQNSIVESVHALLVSVIDKFNMHNHYEITQNSICGKNGTEFIFKGIRMNITSIKSMTGINILWIEEAATVSQMSWDVLKPTIREPNSEIWLTFNPESEEDPIFKEFFHPDGTPRKTEGSYIRKVNWDENKWFPEVLKKEKDHLYRVNPDLADHVWGGNVRKNSASQIFRSKWVVREFEPTPEMNGPYFGADFGFSTDPSTLVKVYLDLQKRELLVRYAKFGYHVDIDKLPAMYDTVPESAEFLIRADNARPETISYIARQRFNIMPADKWPGSVEDGIEWLKSFDRIVFHPDCEQKIILDGVDTSVGMITEAKNYSFKVDRLTGDVLTDIVDAYNHGWDAIRYALDPLIQSGNLSILDVL